MNLKIRHLALGALLTGAAEAATLVFIQDVEITLDGDGLETVYTGAQDAELREADPDTNHNLGTGAANPEFTVDGDDPGGSGFASQVVMQFRGIFDLIPAGSFITGATLSLDIDDPGDDMSLYILGDGFVWLEASTTWNNFGIFEDDGVRVGYETIGEPTIIDGGGDRVSIDVTSDVQTWYAGARNNGWAFIPGGDDGVDFDASEHSNPNSRPSLAIEFVIPEPGAPLLLLCAGAWLGLARRRQGPRGGNPL